MTLPTILTPQGLQPQKPTDLLAQLIALVSSTVPGYTANLPGSLIDDISGTDVGAMILIDNARVELVNSLTPYGANEFILNQLGQIYGVQLGATTNTSVYVVFTGSIGYIIPTGFTVSDGNYQYTVVDGGVIPAGGTTTPLYCLATQTGSWSIPAGTVTTINTSVPSGYILSCTNTTAGTPSSGVQTVDSYRAQVLNAGLVMSTGMATMLTAQLSSINGVNPLNIAIQQQTGGAWKVIVGGGDPYTVSYAIYKALGASIGLLVGSTMTVTSITNATVGLATTSLNHGLGANGAVVSLFGGNNIQINGVTGMTGINGVNLTITIVSQNSFTIGINTTSLGTYVANSGTLTPNPRNQNINIIDGSNTYSIKYVLPPQQVVIISLVWNVYGASNLISASAVSQLGSPAISVYINSIPLGQPINLFAAQEAFVASISSLVPANLIDKMLFTVTINGVVSTPLSGTQAIVGDVESYFYTTPSAITITQG